MLVYLALAVLCISMVSATGPCAPNEDMLQMLNLIHKTPSYSHLSPESKAMLPELVSAAQSCQLTAYVYTNGLYKVLDLLDSLTPQEAHLLNSYLKAGDATYCSSEPRVPFHEALVALLYPPGVGT